MKLATPLSFVLLAAGAFAQWPTNPAQNVAVGDGTGEQVLNKQARTADGGCYVGWFDNFGGSYAVRLQRLLADGSEAWPHNGIVVSANPQSSSLVDWDLIVASDGTCVLTFTDTRAGGDLDCYAYRFDANGTPLWGASGIALSNNADYEPNPRVAETSDGMFAFTWVNTVTRTVQLQRGSTAGSAQFPGDGIAFPGDAGATPGFVQICASDNGSVMLLWVRATAFSAVKNLHAMKFDAAGAPVWNGGVRLPVFDLGSVPIAHQPKLAADGQGGAWMAWHHAPSQQFVARVQRLTAGGTEVLAHNGVPVSSTANSMFDPALAVDAATTALTVFWNERNLAQSQWGIGAQRFDAAGSAQWGATGVTLVPVGTTTFLAPVAAPFVGGAFGAVLEQVPASQNKLVRVFALDANGAALFASPTHVGTSASDKLRLGIASTHSGAAVLGWTDLRAGNSDVFAQAIASDGTLAPAFATASTYGCGGNPAGSLTVAGRPSFGAGLVVTADNPLGTQPNGALPLLMLATAPLPTFPCGLPLPGFGLAGPSTPGELLVDSTTIGLSLVMPVWLPGVPSSLVFPVPYGVALVGFPLYAQGAMVDFTPGALVPIGLTAAQRWVLGY